MFAISAEEVYATLGLIAAPLLIDVRSEEVLRERPRIIPGSRRIEIQQLDAIKSFPHDRPIVAYCAHGSEHSRTAAEKLRTRGYQATYLEQGINAWIESRRATTRVRFDLNAPGNSRWITRERPKIDRLACPWLVRRFIDPDALFFYTPAHQVRADATILNAQPYDIADVTFSHRGERCSFDAFLDEFDLHDAALDRLADIVRAADTGKLAASAQAPGLLAVSLGMSANVTDDILLLEQAMPVYDALYAWCKLARDGMHSWPQRTD